MTIFIDYKHATCRGTSGLFGVQSVPREPGGGAMPRGRGVSGEAEEGGDLRGPKALAGPPWPTAEHRLGHSGEVSSVKVCTIQC